MHAYLNQRRDNMVTNMVPKLPYFENRGDFRSLCTQSRRRRLTTPTGRLKATRQPRLTTNARHPKGSSWSTRGTGSTSSRARRCSGPSGTSGRPEPVSRRCATATRQHSSYVAPETAQSSFGRERGWRRVTRLPCSSMASPSSPSPSARASAWHSSFTCGTRTTARSAAR